MKRKPILALLLLVGLLGATLTTSAMPIDGGTSTSPITFWLTVLHNNDGESQVINAGPGLEDFGGAAAFKTVVDNLRAEATRSGNPSSGATHGVVMISSGDNFLAGPEFNVSLVNGVPFYDTIAMDLIDYDAINFGNHDFDFGPDVLAQFLDGYGDPPPTYVSANLDFTGEPVLQAYVDAGVIRPNVIVRERGVKIGIIGLETPSLSFSSSPRNVIVGQDLVKPVMTAAGRMKQRGVNVIILTSHLQDIRNEIDLVHQLSDIDIVISGGGNELLANPGDLLIPGDSALLPYPVWSTDSTGKRIPIVTTSGNYGYVGRLVVGFDANGDLVYLDRNRSGPVRVATGDCNDTRPCDDAVVPDAAMTAQVVRPARAGLAALEANIIGASAVNLNGSQGSVRTRETNQGNLMADALLWQGQQNAADYGVLPPDVALQNSGGIRNDSFIAAGNITTLDTFDMAPFPNFVVIADPVSRAQFKEIMENTVACSRPTDAASNPNCGTGRFAQIAGFTLEWAMSGKALILDLDGKVVQVGTRVRSIVLDDGTEIVKDGVVVPGAPVVIATNDFSARGGDQYPFGDTPYTSIGATYQQAIHNYITDALAGKITADDYPAAGEGRIKTRP